MTRHRDLLCGPKPTRSRTPALQHAIESESVYLGHDAARLGALQTAIHGPKARLRSTRVQGAPKARPRRAQGAAVSGATSEIAAESAASAPSTTRVHPNAVRMQLADLSTLGKLLCLTRPPHATCSAYSALLQSASVFRSLEATYS
eukprot:2689522-Prymnesium_polylepis.1